MTAAPGKGITQLLGSLPILACRPDLADAELLRRFAAGRDEAAFAALVGRHGPLVLGVCRRVLGEDHAAEDAFQATFLLLARKAARLTRDGSLAGWLHTAARRTAGQARRADRRRRRREVGAARPDAAPADDLAWREVRQLLDAELTRLPEHYRTPLILCYLNGLSQAEAARQLGWGEATLRGRLERGRLALRRRLTRLGLPLAALLVPAAPVPVSAALGSATLATVRAALSGEEVSPAVATLAGGVSRSIVLYRWAAAVAVLLATSAVGLAVVGASLPPVEPPPPTPAVPIMRVRAKVDLLGDPLPPDALHRLGTLRYRQLYDWRFPRQILPDGKTVLTATDREILWVDMTTGKLADSWPMPKEHLCRGLSPDGKLAVLFDLSSMRLWDLITRKELRVLRPQGNYSTPTETFFSPDGKLLAVHSGINRMPGLARVFDIATGRQLWHDGEPGNPNHGFWPLGFLDDNKTLLGLDVSSNEVRLRDRETGKVLRSFPTMPRDGMLMSLLSPDGKTVFQGTIGPAARAWDVATGKEMPLLGGHQGQAIRVAVSRDGWTVLTGGASPAVFVWEWPAGKLRKRITLGRGDGLQSLSISADGRRAEVILLGEIALRFYDLGTGKELPPPVEAHRGPANAVTVTPDGRVFSTGTDDTLRVWDLRTGRHLGQLPGGQTGGGPRPTTARGNHLLATAHPDRGEVVLREWQTGRVVRRVDTGGNTVPDLALSADGRRLAVGGFALDPGNGQNLPFVGIWEVRSGRQEHRLPGTVAGVPAFSPDGRLLAGYTRFDPERVQIWEVATGKERAALSQKDVAVLAFTPGGRALAIADPKGITLWELASGKVRGRVEAPIAHGTVIQFSPDGRWLARVDDQDVRLFDVLRTEPAHTFCGHDGFVLGLAFTPDGTALVSSSMDTTLLVWDMAGVAKRRAAPARPDAAATEAAWKDLAGADANAAYRAIRLLAESPGQGLPLIRERLRPAAPPDAGRMNRLLAGLGSDRFAKRERAMKELGQMGENAEGPLRRLLAAGPPLEVKRRAEVLLARLEGPVTDPERLRQLRVVEVLEWVGDAAARRILQSLAAGPADARLTYEAAAALRRLRGGSRTTGSR